MRNWLKTVLLVVGIGLSIGAAAMDTASAGAKPAHAHGVHGMVLFGEPGQLLASHLPLYRHPHDWQVVVELVPASPEGLQHTATLLKAGGLLTLEPEHFDLLRLQPGAAEPLTRFKGKLYRDHFERGGELVAVLDWQVKRTWVFEPVRVQPTSDDGHRYFPIGEGPGRQWLLHKVERRPDVDQILMIEATEALNCLYRSPTLLSNTTTDAGFRSLQVLWQDTDDLH